MNLKYNKHLIACAIIGAFSQSNQQGGGGNNPAGHNQYTAEQDEQKNQQQSQGDQAGAAQQQTSGFSNLNGPEIKQSEDELRGILLRFAPNDKARQLVMDRTTGAKAEQSREAYGGLGLIHEMCSELSEGVYHGKWLWTETADKLDDEKAQEQQTQTA